MSTRLYLKNKKFTFKFRLSVSDYDRIAELSECFNVSSSEVIRFCILHTYSDFIRGIVKDDK